MHTTFGGDRPHKLRQAFRFDDVVWLLVFRASLVSEVLRFWKFIENTKSNLIRAI